MQKLGKQVGDDLYVHLASLDEAVDPSERLRITDAQLLVRDQYGASPNVFKLNRKSGRLSLLWYPTFEDEPFPALASSWTFASGAAMNVTYRSYEDSLNPPILHRKELLVHVGHPNRAAWRSVTETAESLGLFDDTTTIGFRLNWHRLIASKGYRLEGNAFVPLGNAEEPSLLEPYLETEDKILRHLTALSRTQLSAPIQLLLRHGLLDKSSTLFDYGCGQGDDIAGLLANGYTAQGWDPHFAAEAPIVEADVVNLGFVVNVIEDPAERVEAIQRAFKLARKVMAISVMLHGGSPAGVPYRDGFRTSRNTFQKYFTQGELKDFIEHVLHQEVFMTGPGVAYVFADKALEQSFCAARYRTRHIAARLLATCLARPSRAREPRIRDARRSQLSGKDQRLELLRPQLDALWSTTLELGRVPEVDEAPMVDYLVAEIGSYAKAVRFMLRDNDLGLLRAAAATRADDVRLYLASLKFRGRPAYRQLELRLQRDIKAFFGDYKSAEVSALSLLRDAADPNRLLAASQEAAAKGLGWLNGDRSLQLHVSLVGQLPAVLRAYVSCGLMLWDAVSDVQLVKIHIPSRKLSLMEFVDFESNPVPVMRRRVKVNLRRLDYDVFDYTDSGLPTALLYNKSRYLHEDYPGYAEQLAFDDALAATGVLGDSEYGPSAEELASALEARRLSIDGMRLGRSARIPDLDQACGANFTFRDLIECGETQQRLQIRNIPLRPATYNALYDLATQVLDPVIEYFGSIRLTYGFSGTNLTARIERNIAPKLDQHASCELSASNRPICSRLGAACDFIVEDENMLEVARWIMTNLRIDRLYFYGADRPIHVSFGPQAKHTAYTLERTRRGDRIPRQLRLCGN